MATQDNNGSELDPNPVTAETPESEALNPVMADTPESEALNPVMAETPEPEAEKLVISGGEIPIEEFVDKITLEGDPPPVEGNGNADKNENENKDDSESESESESENSESETSSSSPPSSSSSSSSGSSSDEDDEDEKIRDFDEEKMVSWSAVDDDTDDEVIVGPIRSKHEIQKLPPVPQVDVTLEPHHQMLPVGVVMSTLGSKVVVEGVEKHEPLNEGSVLWLTQSRKPLGFVDEIFGPVKNPYYVVRYNSESEVPAGIQGGTTLVSFVPEFADRVLNFKELYSKGYDASGPFDEEVNDEVEFSDDEKEAEYKKMQQMQKMAKRGVNDQNPGKKRNNRKKFTPNECVLPIAPNAPVAAQRVLPTVPNAPASAPLVNHGNRYFPGIGQGQLGGTTTVSPFQPLNAGPNFATNGMWPNGTTFPQQPQPQPDLLPNGFPTNAGSYYPQNTQFSHQFPAPGIPFQQQFNPNQRSLFPSMMPGVQPNIFTQQPMYAPQFAGQNQMAFDSSSPFQQMQPPPQPIFQAQQGFPPPELQSDRNLNLHSSSIPGNPSQFHPGSSASLGRPTFRGGGRRGWRPTK